MNLEKMILCVEKAMQIEEIFEKEKDEHPIDQKNSYSFLLGVC